MHLQDIQLKCSFVNHRNTPSSIYHQKPSFGVDAAWEYLHQNACNFLITTDEVRRLGKDPAVPVHAAEEWNESLKTVSMRWLR